MFDDQHNQIGLMCLLVSTLQFNRMQHGLGLTLEHEENDQHSKEDIRGCVDSLEVKQGVQDAKISKPEQSHTKKWKRTVAEWAPP